MLDPSAMQQARMNTNLPLYVGTGRDEKKALKRAKEAERAFRTAKGYEPDTFWRRLRRKFQRGSASFSSQRKK